MIGLTVMAMTLSNTFALGPRLELSDRWLDFGTLEVGEQDSQVVTVENSGDQSVEIFTVDIQGDDPFQVDGNDCERWLEPGDSCDIEVNFEPEEDGEFSAEVEIDSSIGNVEIQVSGESEYNQ